MVMTIHATGLVRENILGCANHIRKAPIFPSCRRSQRPSSPFCLSALLDTAALIRLHDECPGMRHGRIPIIARFPMICSNVVCFGRVAHLKYFDDA